MSCRLLVTDVMWQLFLKPDVILCRKRTVCVLQRPGYVLEIIHKNKFWINHVIHTVYLLTVLEIALFVSTMKPETP
jgi:hypothetical protein